MTVAHAAPAASAVNSAAETDAHSLADQSGTHEATVASTGYEDLMLPPALPHDPLTTLLDRPVRRANGLVPSAGGGSRTLTPLAGHLILSQARMTNFATPARGAAYRGSWRAYVPGWFELIGMPSGPLPR